jgi:hypothetical protein
MKHFLKLTDMYGREIFVSAEDIVAISNYSQEQSYIAYKGLQQSILVNHTQNQIINTLTELGVIKVIN